MKEAKTKIALPILMIFYLTSSTLGQPINETAIQLDSDQERKVAMINNRLIGTWELIKTIRFENGDTIIEEPSTVLWLTPEAKPLTTIRIDSLQYFEIEQTCMKCPYLFWKGQYDLEIRTFKGLHLFYLKFIDFRQKAMKGKRRRKALTLEFNGYITKFENKELLLTDKEGIEWIYKLQEN